jgi:hypothetical protein
MSRIPSTYRELASRVFAAHAGAGPEVAGYGVTPWRGWLFVGAFGMWFAVPKADPLAKPQPFLCSLAQAKANLLAGV